MGLQVAVGYLLIYIYKTKHLAVVAKGYPPPEVECPINPYPVTVYSGDNKVGCHGDASSHGNVQVVNLCLWGCL